MKCSCMAISQQTSDPRLHLLCVKLILLNSNIIEELWPMGRLHQKAPSHSNGPLSQASKIWCHGLKALKKENLSGFVGAWLSNEKLLLEIYSQLLLLGEINPNLRRMLVDQASELSRFQKKLLELKTNLLSTTSHTRMTQREGSNSNIQGSHPQRVSPSSRTFHFLKNKRRQAPRLWAFMSPNRHCQGSVHQRHLD